MIDPPAKLPVDHLSVSSMELLEKCPEKWKLRYIDHAYEPPTGNLIIGGAVWAAEVQHYGHQIETGEGLSLEDVQDEFSAEWDDRVQRNEVLWEDSTPGEVKDEGFSVVERYHSVIVPEVVPVTVEREFKLQWPEVDWDFIGYIDLETADGQVADTKVKKKALYKPTADKELQPVSYLTARRAEGNPASWFRYHVVVRPGKQSAARAYVQPTTRTDEQLDAFERRVMTTAREIAWRAENDEWGPAPAGAWWCDPKYCGYYGGMCPWTRR